MIGIIDYGMGNIQSVINAFARLGSRIKVVTTGSEMKACGGLVLPGVGAFSKAMINLGKADLIGPLKEKTAGGTPLLGICLGLQLLAETSEEHGVHQGLGILPGHVRRIPVPPGFHLPHIGWNGVTIGKREDQVLFKGIKDDSAYYFVHSFMLECDARYVTATTNHGCTVTAAIQSGSVYAVQFHPEKSQSNGLRLLKNFIERVPAESGTGEAHA